MAIKKGNIIITGSHGGLTGYISRGTNIFRKSSSISPDRVKNDPSFRGFRESGNRMKKASPIAASLYRKIPQKKKEFAMYRLLTGEVIKMIKAGIKQQVIRRTLFNCYIAPLLIPEHSPGLINQTEENRRTHGSARATVKKNNMSAQPKPKKISSSTSDLVYFGRLKGSRKLKIWLKIKS